MIKKRNHRTIKRLKRLVSKRLIRVYIIISVVLLSLLFIIKTQQITQAKIPEYLYFQKGSLPVIISIPHDGRLDEEGLPERTNTALKNFSKARDYHTTVMGLAVSENLEKLTGKKPYMIVNLLHRKYMDPNRAPDEAYEQPLAEEIYHQYDLALKEAISEVKQKYQKGILLDLHGQTEYADDVYILTLDGKTMETTLEKNIRQILQDKSYKVATSSPEQLTVSGSIIDRHGKHTMGGIDALQVEIHRRVRYEENERDEFAQALSEAIRQLIKDNE